MIKAVLFDFDGVLCDLREVHYAALNAALVAHGYTTIGSEEHRNVFDGLPTRRKLEILLDLGRVREEDFESIRALKQRETIKEVEKLPFDPNVFCLIAGLHVTGFGLQDVSVGVVSNAVHDTVVSGLRSMKLLGFFDVIVSNEDGLPKPSPYLYLNACAQLDLHPGECLAVEDNKYGIEAATTAGCVVRPVTSPDDVTPKLIWSYLCSTS